MHNDPVMPSEPEARVMKLANIVLEPKAQPRARLNEEVISSYAESMKDGTIMPPLDVFDGPEGVVLADGFHRYHALKKAGYTEFMCRVHPGTVRDAVQFAVGANASHGLQRTIEDKRRAVAMLLDDPEWAKLSDREIERIARVNRVFISTLRKERESQGIKQPKIRVNAKGEKYDPTKGVKKRAAKREKAKASRKRVVAAAAEPEMTYGQLLIEFVRSEPPSGPEVLAQIRNSGTEVPHNSLFVKFAKFVENVGFDLADLDGHKAYQPGVVAAE